MSALRPLAALTTVRDDHLCEERGDQFSQKTCRDALLEPLLSLWAEYGRSWFCGTKIDPNDLRLYVSTRNDRRRRLAVAVGHP